MLAGQQLRFSYEDYLRLLDESELRLEYSAGVIYAMAGGTIAHAQLAAAATRLLGNALHGPCTVLSSDAKVRVEVSDFAGFPDVSVFCGERQTSRIDANALTNPTLIVEVTSRSTEDYDRGDKLAHYQRLPSLNAVVFISHRERRVTLVERRADGWHTTEVAAGETLNIVEPRLAMNVDGLYSGVTLDSR